MKKLKAWFTPFLICLTGICCFHSCKKSQNEVTLQKNEPAVAVAVENNLAKSNSDNFSAIIWGTAKSQPILTHEVHGDVVNGKLYIFGGYDAAKRPNAWTPTKHAYVYDPIANTWAAIADLPQVPNGPGFGGITHAGLISDGINIYMAGGYTSNANGTGQVFGTKQVWRYNVNLNTYTRLPDLPMALATGQLRYLNGKIHYMGGANLSRVDVNIHYALTLDNLSAGWKALEPLNNPANHPGSAVYNGKIYFLGGAHGQDENTITQKTLEVYEESTNKWTNLASMPVGRDHIASDVVVMGARILVLGGETSHNVLSKLVSAYTPATNTWSELMPLTAGKSAGVAAVLNGNLYYTGGNFSNINRKGIPVVDNAASVISPLADAFVRDGSFAAINYGQDTTLLIKASPVSGFTRKAYIKFSLKDTNYTVTSAKLRIYGFNKDNTALISVFCYGADDDSWTENGIIFNNAPAGTATALSTAGIDNQAKYIEFDVTNYIKIQLAGDKTASFVLRDPANKNINLIFNSRDNIHNKPQLIIY